jgi:aminomethyltransferase
MTGFAGWSLPVYYTSIIAEHLHTRAAAGIFDISHMGELQVSGKGAHAFLQSVMSNDLDRLQAGRCFYSAMCNERGGTVDDCFIYEFTPENFWVIVNAANIRKDFDWLESHTAGFEVEVDDLSAGLAKIDLQGPLSGTILQNLTPHPLARVKRFDVFKALITDLPCTISRSGYTGEDGFEIYTENNNAAPLWNALLESDRRVKPVGLGARDTLRIEACYSLYGHELTEDISPVEAGIGWVVREKKASFPGKAELLRQKKQGTARTLVAFKMLDRAIPRPDYEIYASERPCGTVSSGCYAPGFKIPLGMGFVPAGSAAPDTTIRIKIRDKFHDAHIVRRPFYIYKGE